MGHKYTPSAYLCAALKRRPFYILDLKQGDGESTIEGEESLVKSSTEMFYRQWKTFPKRKNSL